MAQAFQSNAFQTDAFQSVVDYKISLEDSLSLAAAVGKSATVPESDSVVFDEDVSRINTFIRSKEDSIAISDQLSDLADWTISIGDGVPLNDSLSMTIARALASAIGLDDDIDLVSAYVRSFPDNLSLADGIKKGIAPAVADSMPIADLASKAAAVTKQDTFTLADAIVRATGLPLASALAIADGVSRSITKPSADAIALDDDYGRSLEYRRSFLSTFPISDSLTDLIDWLLSVDDTLAIADDPDIAYTIQRAFFDALRMNDDMTLASGFVRSFDSGLSIADVIFKLVDIAKSETMDVADAITMSTGIAMQDALSVADYLSRTLRMMLADGVGVGDGIARTVSFIREHSGTLGISDSLEDIIDWFIDVADALGLEEEHTALSEFSRALEEGLAINEAVNRSIGKVASTTVTMDDSIDHKSDYHRGFANEFGVADVRVSAVGTTKEDMVSAQDIISKSVNRSLTDGVGIMAVVGKAILTVKTSLLDLIDAVVKRLIKPHVKRIQTVLPSRKFEISAENRHYITKLPQREYKERSRKDEQDNR